MSLKENINDLGRRVDKALSAVDRHKSLTFIGVVTISIIIVVKMKPMKYLPLNLVAGIAVGMIAYPPIAALLRYQQKMQVIRNRNRLIQRAGDSTQFINDRELILIPGELSRPTQNNENTLYKLTLADKSYIRYYKQQIRLNYPRWEKTHDNQLFIVIISLAAKKSFIELAENSPDGPLISYLGAGIDELDYKYSQPELGLIKSLDKTPDYFEQSKILANYFWDSFRKGLRKMGQEEEPLSIVFEDQRLLNLFPSLLLDNLKIGRSNLLEKRQNGLPTDR